MSKHPESAVLEAEVSDGVATVWLNRPEKRNALGADFWADFPLVMDGLGGDRAVRAVVLQGRGASFTVGLDLALFGEIIPPETPAYPYERNFALYQTVKKMQQAVSSAARIPQPVIAAVHGHCLGGGLDLITAADVRLAAEGAVFSVRETRLGMVADVGTLQRLPRLVGAGPAAELVYTGRDCDARHAQEIGLVNRVYPDRETLFAGARELALEIAANSPAAVQGSKQALTSMREETTARHLDYAALWSAAFLRSADLAEGVAAQMEGRPPRFTGG